MIGLNTVLKFLADSLGIIIAIAGVLIFSYFDPFGWFEPKTKIDSTAILVREVKQIGEFITAEYYGEAITSWPATALSLQAGSDKMELERIISGIHHDFESVSEAESWNDNRRMRYFRNHIRDTYQSSLFYTTLIQSIYEKKTNVSPARNKAKFWQMEDEAVKAIYNDLPEALISTLDLGAIAGNARKKTDEITQKDAVCIGRGIVRAGFDLSKTKPEDIHTTSKVIYITNATPRILSVDMNPWFIPQRKVKGFEILKLKGEIKDEDIRKLKTKCKEMIRQQAIARKIVREAKRNGEEALLNFFNLVSAEPVERVIIVSDHLDEMHLTYDTLNVFSPFQAIDIYNKSYRYLNDTTYYEPQPDSLRRFIQSLKNKVIDYSLGVKDSVNRDLQNKAVSFPQADIAELRKTFNLPDTITEGKPNRVSKTEFSQSYWFRK